MELSFCLCVCLSVQWGPKITPPSDSDCWKVVGTLNENCLKELCLVIELNALKAIGKTCDPSISPTDLHQLVGSLTEA